MSISGLGSLFQTQEIEEAAGVQRIRQEREGEDQRSPGSSHKTDSVTISAEGQRMSEAMRENNARQNNEQEGGQSGAENNGLPGEAISSNPGSAGEAGVSITENGVLEGVAVRALPESILAKSGQHLAKIIEKGTKVLFEFGEDGSVSIKPGLSMEDYMRAQAALREWEMHEPGLGV